MPHRQTLANGAKIHISNDEYTIERLLSRGGTSLIYEAYRPYCNNTDELNLGDYNIKKVLLKELAPYDIPFIRTEEGIHFQASDLDDLEEIFKNEIQNISYIQRHSKLLNYIPDMDAYGRYHGTIYIAMDHIRGNLLSNYIRTNEMNDTTVIKQFMNILGIIQELHNMNPPCLHLDLKPSNFIVDDMGTVYLFDFGSSMKVHGTWIKNYTEDYSAPEIIYNQMERINKSSDIYSLGAILYEMITKKKPVLEQFLLSGGIYYSPNKIQYDFNPILNRMLYHDNSFRYQSVEDIMEDINVYLHNEK